MRVLSFTSFVAAVGATWLVVMAACSSDTPPQLGVGDGCLINTDCTSPLVCAFRKCHVACKDSRDCDPGQRCMASDRPFHVCQLATERTCAYNSDCPPKQACGTDRQCRDQCAADRDCLGGQLCVGATCADKTEVVDGGIVSEAAPTEEAGSSGLPCNYTSECPAPLVCRANLCSVECLTTLDCLPGYSCANNRCVTGSGTLVGADGGKITDSSGKLELDVPRGALRAQVAIAIHALEAWPEGALGQVFQIEPNGINFAVPATLIYTYDAAEIGTTPPAGLRLGFATGSSWTSIASMVDQAQHKVTASIAHLSTYGLLGPGVGGDAGVVGPSADAGLPQCNPLNLMGAWTATVDANTSPEVVTVTNQAPASVTVSFNNPLGAQACGCNAQSLVIPLGRAYPCASTRLSFTYSTAFVSNALESPALQIRFSTGKPPSEPMSYSGDMFDGSVWNGHSNCAYTFGWNNSFPSKPAITNGGMTQIDLSPSNTSPANGWGQCNGTFDTVDVHLEYYGCGPSTGTATLSSLTLCSAPPQAL